MTTTVVVTPAAHQVQVIKKQIAPSGNAVEGSEHDQLLTTQGDPISFFVAQDEVITIQETTEPTTTVLAKVQPGGSVRDVSEAELKNLSS